ncbi:LysR family transcriptional regulator [Actinomadura sp. LOL_016]|uniref:LysR family transcriptional regulator n=1 Tax=unclassified Actinomadura TaxID=2626254 RepID=UPI003A7F7FCB
MELKHLTTFLAVTHRLSFTKAAQDLGYAQSAVTAQIKSLETDLGVPLFERLGRRIALTDAGIELREHARFLVGYAQEVREAVHEAGGGSRRIRGTLRVAAPESLCAYHLPPVLRALRTSFPLLQVVFGPAGRTGLLDALGEGALDAGFLIEESVDHPMVSADRMAEETLVLVAHPEHHLTARTEVHTAELAAETLLLIERGCAQRDVIERELKRAGIRPVRMEFVSVEALKRCAAEGLGLAVLPASTVADEVARGEVAVLPWTSEPVLGIYLVRHKDRRVTTVLRELTALTRAHWA